MPEWLVLADDLTGACDTGAAFAASGWRTRVVLQNRLDFSDVQVWVRSTASRDLPAKIAGQAVINAVADLGKFAVGRVYKKVDSTLRGHPGIELGALMTALDEPRVLVSTAFPEQGRTISGGQVRVNGRPLAETEFGAVVPEPNLLKLFNVGPGSRSLPLAMVRDGTQAVARELAKIDRGVVIGDAETSQDLQTLAEAGLQCGIRLFCGSAGLARALNQSEGCLQTPVFSPAPRPVLVVIGSRGQASQRQAAFAREQGLFTGEISPLDLRIANIRERMIERLANELYAGRHSFLSLKLDECIPGQEMEIADGLAQISAAVIRQSHLAGLALTGGDTAAAVCARLHCAAIDLRGEVQPGIVWGYLAEGDAGGLPVVTKAGGFGGEAALMQAVQFLSTL